MTATTPSLEVERKAKPIARAILREEGFTHIIDGPGFIGTPFDFFAFKNGCSFVIELKASLERFHLPGQTQKERLAVLLERVPEVRGAILQVCLGRGQYRLIEGAALARVLQHRQAPFESIVQWIQIHLDRKPNR